MLEPSVSEEGTIGFARVSEGSMLRLILKVLGKRKMDANTAADGDTLPFLEMFLKSVEKMRLLGAGGKHKATGWSKFLFCPKALTGSC